MQTECLSFVFHILLSSSSTDAFFPMPLSSLVLQSLTIPYHRPSSLQNWNAIIGTTLPVSSPSIIFSKLNCVKHYIYTVIPCPKTLTTLIALMIINKLVWILHKMFLPFFPALSPIVLLPNWTPSLALPSFNFPFPYYWQVLHILND